MNIHDSQLYKLDYILMDNCKSVPYEYQWTEDWINQDVDSWCFPFVGDYRICFFLNIDLLLQMFP